MTPDVAPTKAVAAASRQRAVVVFAVLLATFMAAMEATVVATAMPTVVTSLGGLEDYGWVGAIYLLASTVTTPLGGKLADVHGRRPVMLAGIFVFLLGSMASGLAQSMTQLIVFRGVQGIGAGAVQPISLTMIGDLYPPEKRPRIQGISGAVWGSAAMVGPLLGGLIVRVLSWRWVFFVNVPFGVLSAALIVAAFGEQVERTEHRFDVAGAAALSGAIVAVLLATSRVAPLLMLPIAAAMVVAFVMVERRAAEPILPLPLLARPVVAMSSLGGAMLGSVMTSTVMFVPLFVQAVLHGTATEAGTTVAPMLVGWPIASAASGKMLVRVGFRPMVRAGFIVVALSSVALFGLLRPGTSTWPIRAAMTTFGVGLGLANTALIIAVQDAVDWSQRGVATATTMFSRSIGGALAVGGLGAVLAAALGPGASADEVERLMNPRMAGPIEAASAQLAAGLQTGLQRVFAAIAAIAVGALIVGLMFPKATVRE